MDIEKFKKNSVVAVKGAASFAVESAKEIGSVISKNAKETKKNIGKELKK